MYMIQLIPQVVFSCSRLFWLRLWQVAQVRIYDAGAAHKNKEEERSARALTTFVRLIVFFSPLLLRDFVRSFTHARENVIHAFPCKYIIGV